MALSEEQKKRKKDYDIAYMKENYDRIYLRVKKGEKEKYMKKANAVGMSLAEWIVRLMENA